MTNAAAARLHVASELSAAGPREDPAQRRSFTTEFKGAIITEYDGALFGSKGAVLRRERLYDSYVKDSNWSTFGRDLETKPELFESLRQLPS